MSVNQSPIPTASRTRQARRYAERNWPVFPCQDKRPRTTNGFKDASTNPDRIRSWWQRWPDATIGVACGEHVTVLDVDSPTGLQELRTLAKLTGLDLSSIPQARTPHGRHYWFAGNGLRRQLRVLHDVDLLGHGGYVIAPPAPDRAWTRPPADQLPVMPAALHDRLVELSSQSSWGVGAVEDPIMMGTRNNTLTRFAGAMRRQGMSEAAILSALQVENIRCTPPLPDAEVETIAQSVARYAPAEQGSHFAKSEMWLVQAGLGREKNFYDYLVGKSVGTGRVHWLTEQQIANDLQCNPRTVRRWSLKLADLGLLNVRPRERRQRGPNVYTLVPLVSSPTEQSATERTLLASTVVDKNVRSRTDSSMDIDGLKQRMNRLLA